MKTVNELQALSESVEKVMREARGVVEAFLKGNSNTPISESTLKRIISESKVFKRHEMDLELTWSEYPMEWPGFVLAAMEADKSIEKFVFEPLFSNNFVTTGYCWRGGERSAKFHYLYDDRFRPVFDEFKAAIVKYFELNLDNALTLLGIYYEIATRPISLCEKVLHGLKPEVFETLRKLGVCENFALTWFMETVLQQLEREGVITSRTIGNRTFYSYSKG